jgi:IclR family KDG regulon transcriptional repressor
MKTARFPAGSIKSAQRVLDILEALAGAGSGALSPVELGKQLGVPRSSLHGLLRVLVGRGYVELESDARTCRLGSRLLGLGSSYLAGLDLHEAAKAVMAVVARLTAETITLDVARGASMITIALEDGRHPIRVVTRIGWPFALYATASGKVVLASLSDKALEALFPEPNLPPITANTIPTVDRLRDELATVRQSGVAYAHGEINEGVEAVAVPIIDHNGQVVAALDALIPLSRAQPDHLWRVERVLRAGAGLVSARMGAPGAPAEVVVDVERYLEQVWGTNGLAAAARSWASDLERSGA